MMGGGEIAGIASKRRDRVGWMKTAMRRVVQAKSLSKDADMGGGSELIEPRARRGYDTPGHRRHDQGALAHIVEQPLDERLGAETSSTEPPKRAVHEQHPIARHLGSV